MANGNNKVVVNLATGLEDAERVTVAFLVAGAAVEQGKQVAMFLTKEAVRLALPGHADAVACEGCPPLARLFQQYADGGGELLVCPICFEARSSAARAWCRTRASAARRRSGLDQRRRGARLQLLTAGRVARAPEFRRPTRRAR